jgi:hypothetical protein
MKKKYSSARPYGQFLAEEVIHLRDVVASVPASKTVPPAIQAAAPTNGHGNGNDDEELTGVRRLMKPLRAFGYTVETAELLLAPMASGAAESLGSMGNDAPLGFMSQRPKLLYDYFKQLFAQVGVLWHGAV